LGCGNHFLLLQRKHPRLSISWRLLNSILHKTQEKSSSWLSLSCSCRPLMDANVLWHCWHKYFVVFEQQVHAYFSCDFPSQLSFHMTSYIHNSSNFLNPDLLCVNLRSHSSHQYSPLSVFTVWQLWLFISSVWSNIFSQYSHLRNWFSWFWKFMLFMNPMFLLRILSPTKLAQSFVCCIGT
jgi:hypothetical protein